MSDLRRMDGKEPLELGKQVRQLIVGRRDRPWLMTLSLLIPGCPSCGKVILGYLIPLPLDIHVLQPTPFVLGLCIPDSLLIFNSLPQ